MGRVLKFLLSLFIFAVVCYVGLGAFVDSEVAKELNQTVADTPGMELAYDDLSVDIFDHVVELDKVAMILPGGQRFTADSLSISRFDNRNAVPHFADMRAQGLDMTVSPSDYGVIATTLQSMGISRIKGDVIISYDYDPNAKVLTLNELDIKSAEVGDLHLSGNISEIDLPDMRSEKLIGLRIADADLTFIDRSWLDSLLEKTMGDKDKARSAICAELDAMAEYAGKEENPVAENALRGLKRFVDQPGTIAISARPAEPVPVLYFFMGRDFYDNLRLLNVEVVTNSSDDI